MNLSKKREVNRMNINKKVKEFLDTEEKDIDFIINQIEMGNIKWCTAQDAMKFSFDRGMGAVAFAQTLEMPYEYQELENDYEAFKASVYNKVKAHEKRKEEFIESCKRGGKVKGGTRWKR